MQIDLYNNHEQYRKEIKQSFEFRRWARRLHIAEAEFEQRITTHPRPEDIRILLDLKEHHLYMNKKDTQVFNHIWQQIYRYQVPITQYHRKKLQQIIDGIEYRRNRIKQAVLENNDHNEEKKGSFATTSTNGVEQ